MRRNQTSEEDLARAGKFLRREKLPAVRPAEGYSDMCYIPLVSEFRDENDQPYYFSTDDHGRYVVFGYKKRVP